MSKPASKPPAPDVETAPDAPSFFTGKHTVATHRFDPQRGCVVKTGTREMATFQEEVVDDDAAKMRKDPSAVRHYMAAVGAEGHEVHVEDYEVHGTEADLYRRAPEIKRD